MASRKPSAMGLLRRPAVSFALALVAATVVLEPLVAIARGGSGPGWSHWLCSPEALRSAVHSVGGSKLAGAVLTALEVHWPHFIPLLVGLAMLVYLWRANARYHSEDGRSTPVAADPGSMRELPIR
jgi:hypothetical protein